MRKTQAVVVTLFLVALIALASGCGASKPVVKSVAPKEGFPGTGFKVTGTDFGESQGKSTVRLGSKTVKASSWSTTKISASVPKGLAAGSYNIIVTTAGGSSNKISFNVSSGFTAESPLPAMMNYLKSKGVNTAEMSFSVVATSKIDPNWKLDKATGTGQDTSYFLFHKDSGGWAIVDYGTDLNAGQLKADGAPSDIAPTEPAGSSPP